MAEDKLKSELSQVTFNDLSFSQHDRNNVFTKLYSNQSNETRSPQKVTIFKPALSLLTGLGLVVLLFTLIFNNGNTPIDLTERSGTSQLKTNNHVEYYQTEFIFNIIAGLILISASIYSYFLFKKKSVFLYPVIISMFGIIISLIGVDFVRGWEGIGFITLGVLVFFVGILISIGIYATSNFSRFRSYFGFISTCLTYSLVILFFLAPDVEWIGHYIYQFLGITFLFSILTGITSKPGIWKKIALWHIGIILLGFILFFVVMRIIWSGP